MYDTAIKRDEHMRKLPEGLDKWIRSLSYNNQDNHVQTKTRSETGIRIQAFMYYKRHGRFADCFCSECGQGYTGVVIPDPDPFKAAAELKIPMPAHNQVTRCMKCGIWAIYKAVGRCKYQYSESTEFMIGQKSGKDFVFRFFKAWKKYSANKKSEYEYEEYIRWFLVPGKKPQKDYVLWSWVTGKTGWYGHNVGGMGNISTPTAAPVHPETYKELSTYEPYRYIPVWEPAKEGDSYNKHPDIVYYYAAASRYPDFEMVVKLDLTAIFWEMVTPYNWRSIRYNSRGRTHYNRLCINKDRMKDIIRHKEDPYYVRACQYEKRMKKHLNDSELAMLTEMMKDYNLEVEVLNTMVDHSSVSKAFRYYKDKLHNYANMNEYRDYIRMRKAAGYDLNNEVFLYPKDLHRRHNEMVLEVEKHTNDMRKAEVNKKYPKIAGQYEALSEKYSAAAGGFIIRPAKEAAELVEEGRILHHCVGSCGDTYLKKHNKAESFILFLRKVKEPDMPYITIEIKDERVVQWYGSYDHKESEIINKKLIEQWIATYEKELKKRKASSKPVKTISKRQKTTKKAVLAS